MKKLLYFLFHRSVIVAVSLLVQIAVLGLMIVKLYIGTMELKLNLTPLMIYLVNL